jgi:hypothetical protein
MSERQSSPAGPLVSVGRVAWPIDDPALIERLSLPHEEFRTLMDGFVGALELPPWDEAFYERAITYPWARPSGSFSLVDGRVLPVDNPAAPSPEGRFPLIAVGSNGAPSTLVRKLAHLADGDRDVLVVAGHLEGFDIGPVARLTPYGSLPATPFPSPGTAVRASVLWVTRAQLAALT